jgi:hypothetical protein
MAHLLLLLLNELKIATTFVKLLLLLQCFGCRLAYLLELMVDSTLWEYPLLANDGYDGVTTLVCIAF